jgi:outer membrane protein assembly factor BamB
VPPKLTPKLLAAAAAVFALGLAGCESVRVGANPEVPLWMHRPSGALGLVYKKRVLAPARAEGEPYERGQPEIDVAGKRVFVGSSDRGLYALSAQDGTVLWRFETAGYVQCEPLYDPREDVVYFGSNDGALYKVTAKYGQLIWRFSTNAEVARRPVLIEPRTGKMVWNQHRAPAMGMEVAGYAGPLVWRGKVYAGFSDGTVTAFDARTGSERWQPVDLSAEAEQTLGEVPQYLDVDTTPVPDEIEAGAVIYVGSYAGGVFALEAESGTQVWSNPGAAGVSELVLWRQPAHRPRKGDGPERPERKLLLAATGTTGLWALDPETGREVWRRRLPEGGVSAPVPVMGALLVSTTQLGLFLLSPIDGSIIDGIHLSDGSSINPAAHGRQAFAVTNGGYFMSLNVTPPI